MALSVNTVFEVRSTASDNNGGGFVTGTSGSNFSLQDAAQYALTGVTSSGAGNTVLSAAAAADMVGNILYVVSGTNFTVGRFQITSVSVGVSITCTTNKAGTAISTGVGATGVMNVGGALATIAPALAELNGDGKTAYVKKTGTYSIGTGLATESNGGNWDEPDRLIGYETTRGDRGRPHVQATGAINMFTRNSQGFELSNFEFDGDGLALDGFVGSAAYGCVDNCIFHDMVTEGLTYSTDTHGNITGCEVYGCGSGATAAITAAGANYRIIDCYVHDNACPGISANWAAVVTGCRITNNTGASSDGLQLGSATVDGNISHNTIHGNGRDGINLAANYTAMSVVRDNLITTNGRYGFNMTSAITNLRQVTNHNYNAYGSGTYGNTSGARNNNAAGGNDVTLTSNVSPYVDDATDDFTLNDTAGGGALCRNAASQPNQDIGYHRHADPSGGSGAGPRFGAASNGPSFVGAKA